jgi:hypothetical protein
MTLLGGKDKKHSDADGGAASSAAGNSNERHASTESSDTIRGPFANMRGTPMKVNTATKKLGYVSFFHKSMVGS